MNLVGLQCVMSLSTIFQLHHGGCEFESRSWQDVLDITLCDKVCQCLWFCPGTAVFSTNKTDRHDITEILLKVAFNAITLPPRFSVWSGCSISSSINIYFVAIYLPL